MVGGCSFHVSEGGLIALMCEVVIFLFPENDGGET